VQKENLALKEILEEVPIKLHTSQLGHALLEDLRVDLRQSEVCKGN